MGDRTQQEGKTKRAKESHDRCSQPPGMRMPKTADLGTQALLVVNSFKLHLNSLFLIDLILWTTLSVVAIKKTVSNKMLSLINNDKKDRCRNVKDIGNLEEHLICH